MEWTGQRRIPVGRARVDPETGQIRLWAQGAGELELAHQYLVQARADDDPMFVWHREMALFSPGADRFGE